MAKGDGLSPLQVGVAGHDGSGVLRRLFADDLDQLHDIALQHVAVVPQGQADIQSHLVVAAAAGVQPLAGIADAGGEGLLHKGVHILGVGVDLQLAGSQIVGDGSQTVEDILTVFLGDDALFGQHRGVHAAAPHILGDHPLIKADGGVEIVDARVHRLGKAAFPQLFCHKIKTSLSQFAFLTHKQHPQTASRKYAVLIGTIYENCAKNGKAAAGENAPAAVPPASSRLMETSV